jgi:hypothetical protein
MNSGALEWLAAPAQLVTPVVLLLSDMNIILLPICYLQPLLSGIHATKVMTSNPADGEVYSIQYYVIQFVSDLRQAGGFLRVSRFLPSIQLTATI